MSPLVASRPRPPLACVLLAVCLMAVLPMKAEEASARRPGPSLRLGCSAGAVLGLDRALRGGGGSVDASLALAGGLGLGAEAGLEFEADIDPGRAPATLLGAALRVSVGPELAFTWGGELLLGEPSSLAARTSGGGRVELLPRSFPSRFGVEATLAELGRRTGTTAAGKVGDTGRQVDAGTSGGGGTRLLLAAALSWSAYGFAQPETAQAAAGAQAQAGAAAFTRGFRARLSLRAELEPLRRTSPRGGFDGLRPSGGP